MRFRHFINIFIFWTFFNNQASGQANLKLVAVPDEEITKRANDIIRILNNFPLRTSNIEAIKVTTVIKNLEEQNIYYFIGLEKEYHNIEGNAFSDKELLNKLEIKNIPEQLDQLIRFANLGFEWPTDCQFFELRLEDLKKKILAFPCCEYFFWYKEFRSLEKEIEEFIQQGQPPELIIREPIPAYLRPSEANYYCTNQFAKINYEEIAKAIEDFSHVISNLQSDLEKRRTELLELVDLKLTSYLNFKDQLPKYLDNHVQKTKETIEKLKAELEVRAETIKGLMKETSQLSEIITRDSLLILGNDRSLELDELNMVRNDEEFDNLSSRLDILYAEANHPIRDIKFEDIDKTVTQETINLIKNVNSQIAKLKTDIAQNRKLNKETREHYVTTLQNIIQLVQSLIPAREQLNSLIILTNSELIKYYELQPGVNQKISEYKNQIEFLSKIHKIFFPGLPPKFDSKKILRELNKNLPPKSPF